MKTSETEWSPSIKGHIPSLDGLRGIAIIMVLVYHQTIMQPETSIGKVFTHITDFGWAGVDLFFVLSGFLITGILFDARGGGNYFGSFYMRRVLRIFPLYYGVVFLCFIILPELSHPKREAWAVVREDQVWYWTYLSNFSIAYYAQWRHAILDISWSLAIEEQFYLIWPLIIYLLNREQAIRLCLALIGLALLIRCGMELSGQPPIRAFVYPFTRMDALATGGLIALLARRNGGIKALIPYARRGFWAGSALLVFIIFILWRSHWKDPLMVTIGFSVTSIFFGSTLVLAVCTPPDRWWKGILNSRFLHFFGKYSYALYLFHLPLRAAIRDTVYGPKSFPSVFGSPIPGQLLFYIAATLLAVLFAVASWHLYERHFLKLKKYFRYR